MPGPHPIRECLPVVVVLRDILHITRTGEEAEYIVSEGLIQVDGRRVTEKRFPLGLMDVLAMPKSQQYYRFVPAPRTGLSPRRIDMAEASFKLRKIVGKTVLRGGQVQLNFHDGATLRVKVADPRKPTEDVFKVGDSISFNVKSGEMLDQIRLTPGAYVLITGGRNMGLHGTLDSVNQATATSKAAVNVQVLGKGLVQTTLANVFAVGSDRPLITLDGET